MHIKHLSKRSIGIALISILILAGCFYVLVSSIRRLPPEAVRPNAKPAINLPTSDQKKMSVDVTSADQATISLTSDSSSSSGSAKQSANCNQPQASQPQQATAMADQPEATDLTTTLNLPRHTDLGAKLQSGLLNVASGLSQ